MEVDGMPPGKTSILYYTTSQVSEIECATTEVRFNG